jgi:polyisoprenoid-binding protein YceI
MSSTQQSSSLAERLTTAIETNNPDLLAEVMTDDATIWHSNDEIEMTVAQVQELARAIAAVADGKVTVSSYSDTASGFVQTQVNEFRLRSGETVRVHSALVARVDASGRIARLEEYLDGSRLAPLVAAMTPAADAVVPEGTWHVDPAAGSVGFEVRTMWGLAKVRGTFARYRGALVAQPQGMGGELVIEAASLDTNNAKRDGHLRSGDFFDVDRHPEIVFTTISVTARGDDLTISGDLRIGRKSVRLHLPVDVERRDGRLRLRTTTSVTRASAGLDWNRLGMIGGDVRLTLDLELTRRR